MSEETSAVTGGVDTHSDQHVAAVVDAVGRILGTRAFPATQTGYQALTRWMGSFGALSKVGVEGTGAYGAGLARYLAGQGVEVVEVDRPNRRVRRRRGKSDTTDAEAAARAALNGEAAGTPKAADGPIEGLRALRVARRSALKARTQAANQIRDLVVTAPEVLRARLRDLETEERVKACAAFRVGPASSPVEATKAALASLARRHRDLSAEITGLDDAIAGLCAQANPGLLGAFGVGPEVASALLVAAGDNPERLSSQASFAALCGASPVEASSGKVVRHRLNLGGNREANQALWRIVMVRLSHGHGPSRAYLERRRQEGRSDREIIRCLKRYVAREVFQLISDPRAVPSGTHLRKDRTARGIPLRIVAAELGRSINDISRLERGVIHNTELAYRYRLWLDGAGQGKAA